MSWQTFLQIAVIGVIWLMLGGAFGAIQKFVQIIRAQTESALREMEKKTEVAKRMVSESSPEQRIVAVRKIIGAFSSSLETFVHDMNRMVDNFIWQVVEAPTDKRSVVKSVFEIPHAGQQIIGAILEFILLVAFLYADASLAAQSYSVLFEDPIPEFLNHLVVPLVVASSGSAFILGIFLGDMSGLTHLGVWGRLPDRWKSRMRIFVISLLIMVIVLASGVALVRIPITERYLLLQNQNGGINANYGALSWMEKWAIWAHVLVIIPMLITTAMLVRGSFGIFVFLAIILYLVSLPFRFFRFLIRITGILLETGIMGVDGIVTRILSLLLVFINITIILMLKMIIISIGGVSMGLIILFYIPFMIVKDWLKVDPANLLEDIMNIETNKSGSGPRSPGRPEAG